MIVVKYQASGVKFVVREDVNQAEFWAFYRAKKKAALKEDPDEEYLSVSSCFPYREFCVVNERLADGCDEYVARPNNWPINCGEPA
tara:strand:- start:1539 stop:1796 length:258 start_codon:yes stop_codon:yes gene_type:complete